MSECASECECGQQVLWPNLVLAGNGVPAGLVFFDVSLSIRPCRSSAHHTTPLSLNLGPLHCAYYLPLILGPNHLAPLLTCRTLPLCPPQPIPFFSGHVFNLLYSCSCLPLFHHGAPVCACAIISQTLLLRPQVLFVLGPWCYVVCLLLRWRWAPTSLLDNSPASTAEVGCRRTCSRTCSRRSPYGPRFAP